MKYAEEVQRMSTDETFKKRLNQSGYVCITWVNYLQAILIPNLATIHVDI